MKQYPTAHSRVAVINIAGRYRIQGVLPRLLGIDCREKPLYRQVCRINKLPQVELKV